MASNAAIQQYVNTTSDPALSVYASDAQSIPVIGNTAIYITNVNEYTINRIAGAAQPAGNTTEVQFNFNGQMDGDDGLTYNPTTDSLDVIGNLTAGTVLTNSLKYANGVAWPTGSTYSNVTVAAYLPTYTGNFNANIITCSNVSGNGAGLTSITAGNVNGIVSFANYAYNVDAANVNGTVSAATAATTADRAATVTSNAQPNITSVGTMTGFTSTGTINLTGASNVALGPIANVKITGGTNGQVLTATSVNGVLAWGTPSAGSLQDVTTIGATTSVAISITNSTASEGYSSGALKVTGGVGVGGNLNTFGHISTTETVFSGNLSAYGPLTVPKFVGRDTGLAYIQGALQNIESTGSADWVAYGDLSDDSNGWMDMGFTGTGFNDSAYTITKESDGYIICQGMPDVNGSPQGGNLVIATGEKGANADIVFAVGGFTAADECARLDHDDLTFFIGGHAYGPTSDNPTPKVVSIDINGNAKIAGNITFGDTSIQATAFTTAKNDKLANAIVWSTAPVANISSGTAGQVAYDAGGNLFVCVATDTWSKITGTTSW